MATPELLKRAMAGEPDLGSQIAELQSDVAAIAATLSKLAERRVAGIREDAQEGIANLMHEGQDMSANAASRLMKLEAKLEQTVRTQPLIAIGLASVVGFLLSEVTHRR
ncbi:DUF883 family protein [Devosia salina]|uniref:DUF883 domain-containing protein n=1 Tax=Devosia salina TaxID=2860336 RepID=A0ABX8WFN9_9HYPH|nr:hypothetical protein [Devosia salina]QYO76277.1 hypothetical protein K1X15_16940 [Devosia salina]